MTDPKSRFTGLADVYAQARPGYPQPAIDYVVQHCRLKPGDIVVDVGCGTGISTRLFAALGFSMLGIEPNADMRRKAEQEPASGSIAYQAGSAENTGLADNSVAAVLAAQAFHWFDQQAALAEFQRIVRPGGWVILIWNERDEKNAVTRGYGDALRQLPETRNVEMKRGEAGTPLLASELFINSGVQVFANAQRLDRDGYRRRAFSASYVPQSGAAAEQLRKQLDELFDAHSQDGFVQMLYQTSVYTGQKPA